MKRTIDVILDDRFQVGTLRYDLQGRRENAAFEYGADWLGDRELFALGPTLPLRAGPQFHCKSRDGSLFHAAIADTEPDGSGKRVIMRDRMKRRQQLRREGKQDDAPPLNALDFLFAVDDVSRVGALRFRDEHGVFQRAQEEGRQTAPPLIELGHLISASRAVEANKETAADLAYLRGRGTSLGGLRPKCSLIDEDRMLPSVNFRTLRTNALSPKEKSLPSSLPSGRG